jgi:hypothetical protein
MYYPKLRTIRTSRQMVDTFKGYNHNLRINDGEFFDMKNMTSDYYPVLSPRKKRGVYESPESPQGLIAKDALCYVDGTDFVMNEYRVDMGLNDEPKQLISMGAYVIIMPDKKYINTANISDHGDIEAEFTTTGPVSFTLCKLDASDYTIDYPPDTDEPANPENMALWIDTSSEPHSLKQYSESAGMWVTIATTYVKISSAGIGKHFERYDGIKIEGLGETPAASLEGSAVVWAKDEDYIVVVGILDSTFQTESSITISRKMPEMDYIVESENRLWGCRYGSSVDGQIVNEIYASKLGDFKNWNCFMGLSTDSYAASVGTDGQFTGAITHMGYPLFFKENFLHKVYGNYPSNFQIQTTACRGVQQGCSKSLAIVNATLFYKAQNGIMGYDGSLPTEASYPLGNESYSEAVGGSHGNKYYVSMKDNSGVYNLFVYDIAKGLWHKEDNLHADCFCSCGGEMYAIDHDSKNIITMLGSGTEGDEVEWMVQTGEIGISSPDMKYISRLTIRLMIEPDAQVAIYAQYEFSDEWEHQVTLKGNNLRSFSIPIRPKRCDHMKLRIEGVGAAKIYSITKTIEQGSELS